MPALWLLFIPIVCYLAWYIYTYMGTGRKKPRNEVDKMCYARTLKERRLYTYDEYETELSRLRTELETVNNRNAALEREIKSHDDHHKLFATSSFHISERPMSIREAANHKNKLKKESYALFRQATQIENEIRMLVELIRNRKRA